MYRFRKVRHLLEYNELKNQEIFFSDIASLNDPMEGYREYYWKGDKIMWKNFFKHYILCLENSITQSSLMNDDQDYLSFKDIPIFISYQNLVTEKYKKMIDDINNTFFSLKEIDEYLNYLSFSFLPITKDEIYFHLRTVHLLLIQLILNSHVKYGLRKQEEKNKPISELIKNISKKFESLLEIKQMELENKSVKLAIFSQINSIFSQFELTNNFNSTLKNNKQKFLILNFTLAYLTELDKLTYPDSYVACFIDNCTNPVIWSHYGDNHKGVALKFNTTKIENDLYLELMGVVGLKSENKKIYEKRKYLLKKIIYSNNFSKMNFFSCIGRITTGELISGWYTDGENKSIFYDQFIKEGGNKWKNEYWKNYENIFLTKLPEWEYEKESRLVLTDIIDLHSDKEARKYKYDFSSLEGIVFGMKTPIDKKLEIIQIIKLKCKIHNRDNFNFYQSNFDSLSKKIVITKIQI